MSGLLIWQLALSSAKQLARSSVGTPVLKIPYGPFYAIALVGYVLIALESVLKPSHCVKNDDVIEWEHEET